MVIDCDGCVMRDIACGDCVVTFLLGPADGLGSAEQSALAVLADGGLVPPLRMRPGTTSASQASAQAPTGTTRPVSRIRRGGQAGRSAGDAATA